MLTNFFAIGVVFAFVELAMYRYFGWFRRLMDWNRGVEIFISIALGVLVGRAMGVPNGLYVAMGNLFATPMTIAFYRLKVFDRYDRFCAWYRTFKVRVNQAARELAEIIHFVWLVVSFPWRLAAKVHRGFQRVRVVLHRL